MVSLLSVLFHHDFIDMSNTTMQILHSISPDSDDTEKTVIVIANMIALMLTRVNNKKFDNNKANSANKNANYIRNVNKQKAIRLIILIPVIKILTTIITTMAIKRILLKMAVTGMIVRVAITIITIIVTIAMTTEID